MGSPERAQDMETCVECGDDFVPLPNGCRHHCLECCNGCNWEPMFDHQDAEDERTRFTVEEAW